MSRARVHQEILIDQRFLDVAEWREALVERVRNDISPGYRLVGDMQITYELPRLDVPFVAFCDGYCEADA